MASPTTYHDSTLTKPTHALDPFVVTKNNGFMPLYLPTTQLPEVWKPLLELVEDMPVQKENGSPGLLATFHLGQVIDKSKILPDLTNEIDKLVTDDGRPDMALITAVFREYSFLSSAYLLEPCWERQVKGLEGYGLGRAVLPKEIAGPLVKTAAM